MAHWTNETIRELRLEKKWSQFTLAIEAEVSESTLNAIEKNKHGTNIETIDRLLQALGYELEAVTITGHGKAKRR